MRAAVRATGMAALVAGACACSACSSGHAPGRPASSVAGSRGSARPTATSRPGTLTSRAGAGPLAPLPPPGAGARILAQDDFSNPASGWPTLTDASASTGYDAGRYRIGLAKDADSTVNPPGHPTAGDVRIEVDVANAGGDHPFAAGVACRVSSAASSLYVLLVTTDGRWIIQKVIAGQRTLLAEGGTPIITSGTNRLVATCVGQLLTIYDNGAKVGDVTDGSLTGGEVGLTVVGSAGAVVRFGRFLAETA